MQLTYGILKNKLEQEKISARALMTVMRNTEGYKFSDDVFYFWYNQITGRQSKLAAKTLRAKRDAKNARERQRRAEARVAKGKAVSAPDGPPKPLTAGTDRAPDEKRRKLPERRFVFTSAQNNTDVHEGFWKALRHFCEHNHAALYVSRFTYNKSEWAKRGGVTKKAEVEQEELYYDPRIDPYILDEQVKVADGLVFCGELDILPTAATPLATLHNYTGPNSGIVPHAKVHLESYATMKGQDAKFMYTTGACTLRNYINRKAGQVATFHHVFGALYVEVSEDGRWFARQLIADDSGAFYDLNTYYTPDFGVLNGENVSVVTLGDIHIEKVDHTALNTALQMLDTLHPDHVFVHDVLDFETRNHHNIKDPHFLADQYFNSPNSVEANVEAAARFLYGLKTRYPNTTIHVVRSNHDQALERWLKDTSAAGDPSNAAYWHLLNYTVHERIKNNEPFDVFRWAVQNAAAKNDISVTGVHFVQEDESVVILDIEHGMHGHRGPNGARGSAKSLRPMGRKTNTGHSHSAYIIDGNWVAGVLGTLDMKYNAGPSSWSHSNIITYANGKRCMITQRGNKWKA